MPDFTRQVTYTIDFDNAAQYKHLGCRVSDLLGPQGVAVGGSGH